MPAGLDRPQEDEFALVNLGVPSPYLAWAFPNHGPVADEYLDLRTLPSRRARVVEKQMARLRAANRAAQQPPHRAQIADAYGAE